MLKNFWRRLFGVIEVNNREFFDGAWDPYNDGAVQRLGTRKEALEMLEMVELAIGGDWCRRDSEIRNFYWHACHQPDLHRDILDFKEKVGYRGSSVIGEPKDVHHIIPPRHSLGYVIFTSKDGRFRKEILEGLYKSFNVLSQGKSVLAVMAVGMLRHESYRGMHVV